MYHYKEKQPRFALVKHEMLNDDAEWRRLSSTAKVLWIYLRSRYNPYKEDRNLATGEIQIKLSYKEMSGDKKRKIEGVRDFSSTKSMRKAICELVNAGFIKQTEKGGKYGGASAYAFIGEWGKFENGRKKRKTWEVEQT